VTKSSAVSAVIRSYPQSTKQTAEFRRSCFPPLGGNYCGSLRKGLRVLRSSAVQSAMEAKMKRRGWAQVHYVEGTGQWDVYDWSEHHDSGSCISSHDEKADAEAAARKWAVENNRKYFGAVV